MNRLVDLTMTLSQDIEVFPGYPKPIIHKWTTVKEDGYYSNMIFLVEHSGTHMDSPAHFIEGAPTIDKLPLDKFIARGIALDFSDKGPGGVVFERDVESELNRLGVEPGRGWYILFRFGWDRVKGEDWIRYPVISDGVAEMLRSIGVEGIGMDTPSPDNAPFNVHKILLPESIVIIENMAGLENVVNRVFELMVFPLKISGGSASPVRAVARLSE